METNKLSLLIKSISSKDKKDIEKLAKNKQISITDTCSILELPNIFLKNYKKQLGYKVNPETNITFGHILASYNLFDILIELMENEKTKIKTKNYETMPLIDLNSSKQRKIEQILLQNTILSLQSIAQNYPQLLANENIIQKINNCCGEPSIKNNDTKKYFFNHNLDGNLIIINGLNQTHTPSFMQFALTHDNLNVFKYLLENNKIRNVSFFNILNALKTGYTDKKPKIKAYPKQIIHYILDNYYNLFIASSLNKELNNRENKVFKTLIQSKSLEMLIIKAKDEEAFAKLIENKIEYEKSNIFQNISRRILSGEDVESWHFFAKMINKHNIKLQKNSGIYYFEKTNTLHKNRKNVFHQLFTEDKDFYENFKKECENQEPNYQNNFTKVQYLIDNDININTVKIRRKLDLNIEKIKKQFNDYYRRKQLIGSDIRCDTRYLSFVNNIILEIPSIITTKEKKDIKELYQNISNEINNQNSIEDINSYIKELEYIILKEENLITFHKKRKLL